MKFWLYVIIIIVIKLFSFNLTFAWKIAEIREHREKAKWGWQQHWSNVILNWPFTFCNNFNIMYIDKLWTYTPPPPKNISYDFVPYFSQLCRERREKRRVRKKAWKQLVLFSCQRFVCSFWKANFKSNNYCVLFFTACLCCLAAV